jgi:phosphatidylglycerol:prolipoprotein diacylglycerol transferase
MYPTLYHAIKDLFGLDIPAFKIVMMFGFFVAIGFLAAIWSMTSEFKRREKNGEISAFNKPVKEPNIISEYAISIVIGFLLGFKLVFMILNFGEIEDNPQAFLLSGQGSWLFGVIGALVSVATKYYQLKKAPEFVKGQVAVVHPYQIMGNLTLVAALSGFLGAKIFHHLEYLDEFLQDPIGAITDPFSGLTYFGGLIFGAAGVLWFANKNGVKWRTMLDIGGPAMMLSYGIGRLGCHTSGDGDWGIENLSSKPDWLSWLPDWAWAYDYPNNVINATLENPVWPTPLYEVIMALILFGILWAIRKKIAAPGVLFSVYLVFSGIERFLIEKIRVNSNYNIFGMEITQAELISSVFVILGILGIVFFTKDFNSKQTSKPETEPIQPG